MNISSLNLTNFRSHSATELHLSPQVTLLLGRVGSGKTSVLDALATLFTGKNKFTSESGAGLRDDIRIGESQFQISAEVDGQTLSRDVTQDKQIITHPKISDSDVRVCQRLLMQLYGTNEEVIQSLLDPRIFLSRDEKKMRNLMAQLLRPNEIVIPQAAREVGVLQVNDVAGLNKEIKKLKDVTRRVLQRDADDYRASLPAIPPELPEVGPIESRSKELTEKIRNDRARISHLTGQLQERARLHLELSEKQGQIGSLEANQREAERLQRSLTDQEKERKNLLSDQERLKKELRDAESSFSRTATELEAKKSQISMVESLTSKCPTCQQGVTEAKKKKIISALSEEERGIALGLEGKSELVDAARREAERVVLRISDIEKNISETKGQIASVQERIKIGKEFAARRAKAEEQSISKPEAEREISYLEKIVASDEEELKGVNEQLRVAMLSRDAQTQYDDTKGKIDALEAEIQKVNAAIDALEGLKDGILESDKAKQFLDTMNSILSGILGQSLEYSAEELFSTEGLSATRFSSGQRVIFDAAIRVAAAKVTGLNILGLDDASDCDEVIRPQLLKFLMESGCQVILCSTTAKRPERIPTGVTVYRLECDGIGSRGVTQVECLSSEQGVAA